MKELPLGIRLEPVERAALQQAAESEQRALSAMGRKIITEYLRRHGWIKDAVRPASGVSAQRSNGL